jgi:hypothetical protein
MQQAMQVVSVHEPNAARPTSQALVKKIIKGDRQVEARADHLRPAVLTYGVGAPI